MHEAPLKILGISPMRLLPLLCFCLLPLYASEIDLPLKNLATGACLALQFNSSDSEVNISFGPTKGGRLIWWWTRDKANQMGYDSKYATCGPLTLGNDTNLYIKHNGARGGWTMYNDFDWKCPTDGSVFAKGLVPTGGSTLWIKNENNAHGQGYVQMIANCNKYEF